MMKRTMQTTILALTVVATSFANPIKEKKEVTQSTITWLGKKVTGEHTGTIQLQSGYLNVDGDQIVGGTFVIDMTSIAVTDLEGEWKDKLEGHLNSDDFFGVNDYPTATLVVNNATKNGNTYTVNGDITIKGTTQPITFDLVMDGNTATTSLTIDRTKFGIVYKSGSIFDGLKDKAIYDDFTLDVTLNF